MHPSGLGVWFCACAGGTCRGSTGPQSVQLAGCVGQRPCTLRPALTVGHRETPRSTTEETALSIAGLNAEREDLKGLLAAALQRLEAVDELVQRADISSAVMEDKVGDGRVGS